MRKSFTMIEMVFVIVITGLVAVSGSMAITQIMQNYAIQKTYAQLELDSASSIRQISKYLQNAIWDSIALGPPNTTNYKAISQINKYTDGAINNNQEVVFFEKNNDVLNGYYGTYQGSNANIPYFSGFIDLANSQGQVIKTAFLADKLNNANIVGNYLYFPFVNQGGSVVDKFYVNTNKKALFQIQSVQSDNQMTLSWKPSKIGDIAVIVNRSQTTIQKDANNNLILVQNGKSTTLAQNVSNFYIWSETQAGVLRIRLCLTNSTMDFMREFCKEGVVMQ